MAKKSIPYQHPGFTIRIVKPEDDGKSLQFRNKVHDTCQRKFGEFLRGIEADLNEADKATLSEHQEAMYVSFFMDVERRIYQYLEGATEGMSNDATRGTKLIETEERIDLDQLVAEIPILLPDELSQAIREKIAHSNLLRGKKVGWQRREIYDEMDKIEADLFKRTGTRPKHIEVARAFKRTPQGRELDGRADAFAEAWADDVRKRGLQGSPPRKK